MIWLAAVLARVASAQSCSCSLGTTDNTLPMGNLLRSGAVQLGLDYGVGQTGGEDWQGIVPARDLQGNSMAEMAMPGHIVQTARLSSTVGLPHGLSASVGLPYLYSVPLYPSDMRGDIARGFLGDTAITGRWGWRKGTTFLEPSLGLTLPTGKVISGVGVRGGRGAAGLVLGGSAMQMLAPVVGLAARVNFARSLYAGVGGYRIGAQLDSSLGARFWMHEQGRLSLFLLGSYLHRGYDKSGETMLDQTGMDCLGAGGGVDWRVWSEQTRTVTLSLRGQAPIVQVVGDPWLAENWSMSWAASFGF